MHLSLYHPSSMLFLPDPTCLHLFQSVSYLSLWRPCSKNLAPNAKKHVLGSTKRRTKSTSAEERIYQAHIHSISNAGRERWPISRCFKMLLDARLLKCKPKKSKLEMVWKLNRRRRGTEHLICRQKALFSCCLDGGRKLQQKRLASGCVVMLVPWVKHGKLHMIWRNPFRPKSLYTNLSKVRLLDKQKRLTGHPYHAATWCRVWCHCLCMSIGKTWESPMLSLSGFLSRILASLSRPIWCASDVFPEFLLHADVVSWCCFNTLHAVLDVKAVVATGCERRHWLRIVDWISWGDWEVEWHFQPEFQYGARGAGFCSKEFDDSSSRFFVEEIAQIERVALIAPRCDPPAILSHSGGCPQSLRATW